VVAFQVGPRDLVEAASLSRTSSALRSSSTIAGSRSLATLTSRDRPLNVHSTPLGASWLRPFLFLPLFTERLSETV